MQTPPPFMSPTTPLPPPHKVRIEAIGDAWRLYMADIGQWILSVLLINLILVVPMFIVVAIMFGSVFSQVSAGANRASSQFPAIPVGGLILFFAALIPIVIVGQLLNTGLQRRALLQARGQAPEFSEVFKLNGMGLQVIIFAAGLYVAVAILEIAMFALVNPFQSAGTFDISRIFIVDGVGLVFGCLQFLIIFAPLIIVDQGLTAWAAVKKSVATFGPQFFPLLGVMILTVILVECGALACGIGILFTMPLMYIIYGVIYNDFFRPMPVNVAEQPVNEYPRS